MITGLDGTGPNLLAFMSTSHPRARETFDNLFTGRQLKKMLERAWKWSKIQREAADSLTVAWAEFVPGWKKMLLAYKEDDTKPNPFEDPDPGK
jgi:hypothetical protein